MTSRTAPILLFFITCICSGAVIGQTRIIDSLRSNVYRAAGDEQRLTALLGLFEEYQSLDRDTMDAYGPVVKALGDKSRNERYKSLAVLAYANWYYRYGWNDSAIDFLKPELINNPVRDPSKRDIYFKLSRATATYYGSKLKFEQALEVLYKILPEAEQYRDTLNIGLVSNTIGSVAIARQQYPEGLKWVNKALALAGSNNRFVQVLVPALLNKANIYLQQGRADSAMFFLNKALPLCRQLENLHYVATGLRLQANAYMAVKRYGEAEKALIEMMKVREAISRAKNSLDDNLLLAEFYANSGQIDKAIELCRKNLVSGKLTDSTKEKYGVYAADPRIRSEYLQLLIRYYKKAGRRDEYQAAMEELLVAKDSLYEANSAEAIAELQTQYDVQKKENTILQQKYQLQKKNFLFYGSLILSAVLLAIGTLLFFNYRKRQRKKAQEMVEQEKRLSQEAVREAGEKERTRIASDLHDNLGAYAASMASNLGYIHLSNQDEGTTNALQQLDANSTAIISELNDTIWVLKKDTLTLIAISDRIKTFISRIRKSYPGVQIEVEEDIQTDHRLSSSHAFHLYRILQEAINNALKHSKAKKVTVTIRAAFSWAVSIHDNGIGMTETVNNGNGLSNMKARGDEAGWHIRWTTEDGQGTCVEIEPTTN